MMGIIISNIIAIISYIKDTVHSKVNYTPTYELCNKDYT